MTLNENCYPTFDWFDELFGEIDRTLRQIVETGASELIHALLLAGHHKFAERLDYTFESLGVIDELRSATDDKADGHIGAYIGAVLQRNNDATWRYRDDGFFDVRIEISLRHRGEVDPWQLLEDGMTAVQIYNKAQELFISKMDAVVEAASDGKVAITEDEVAS